MPPTGGTAPRRRHISKLVVSLLVVVVAITGGVSAYLVFQANQPPKIVLANANFTQACPATATLPALTTSLANPGSASLSWQASITEVDSAGTVWATVSPASGTLAPGQHTSLTLTPAATLCQDIKKATAPVLFRATLRYAQTSVTLSDMVTPTPVVAFDAAPVALDQICALGQPLPARQITLDNTGSNVSVNWQVAISDTDPAGKVWATASPTQGTIAGATMSTLTLTPAPALCSELMRALAPIGYKVTLSYTAQGKQQTITLTDTVTPPMIVNFHGTQMTTAQTCAGLQPLPTIPVMLDNTQSNVPVAWQVAISDTDPAGQVWATVNTTSGTLDPLKQQSITLTPISALCLDVVGLQPVTYHALLSFTAAGKTQQMTLADTITPPPAVNKFQVSQTSFAQVCQSATSVLGPQQVTLDNSASTVPVAWQVAISDTDPAGKVWASPNATSGTVQAGQTATLTLTPAPALCSDLVKSQAPIGYKAILSSTALGQQQTILFTDTVTPPIVINFHGALMTTAQTCAGLQALPTIPVTLDNTQSNVPVNWQISITDRDPKGQVWATVNTTGGTLKAGQQQSITLTPSSALCLDLVGLQPVAYKVSLNFTASGKAQQMTLADTITPPPAVNKFQVSQTSFAQSCQSGTSVLGPQQVTLDNSASTVPVAWQVAISDTDPAGKVWATASPQSGTVQAGQTATLTLSPIQSLCGDLLQTFTPVGYKVILSSTALGKQQTITLTDTVTPSMVVNFHGTLMTTAQTCNGIQPLPAIPLTLDNTGSNVPVQWQVTISDTDPAGKVWAAVNTTGSTLNAGQKQTILLTPSSALCLDLVGLQPVTYHALLSFTVDETTQQMTLADTITPPPAVNKLQVSQTSFTQGCRSASSVLAPEQVTLDNSGSTVSVAWQVAISTTDPAGKVWATASPQSGTVQAGQTATLTLSPIQSLCRDMFFSTGSITYTAIISTTALGKTTPVTVSDSVAPPPSVNNFVVSPTNYTQDCNNPYPQPAQTITLDNTQSNVAVNWSIVPNKLQTASPTSGTVPAGKTATLALTPSPRLCALLGPGTKPTALVSTISQTALGQTKTVNVTDTVTPLAPVFRPNVSPLTFSQNCASGFQLPALNVRLSNDGSNIPVSWKVIINDRDPKGTIWATASPQIGSVPAGTTEVLTITPFFNNVNSHPSNLCQDLGSSGQTYNFTAMITVTDTFGHSQSFTVTDTVTAYYNVG